MIWCSHYGTQWLDVQTLRYAMIWCSDSTVCNNFDFHLSLLCYHRYFCPWSINNFPSFTFYPVTVTNTWTRRHEFYTLLFHRILVLQINPQRDHHHHHHHHHHPHYHQHTHRTTLQISSSSPSPSHHKNSHHHHHHYHNHQHHRFITNFNTNNTVFTTVIIIFITIWIVVVIETIKITTIAATIIFILLCLFLSYSFTFECRKLVVHNYSYISKC